MKSGEEILLEQLHQERMEEKKTRRVEGFTDLLKTFGFALFVGISVFGAISLVSKGFSTYGSFLRDLKSTPTNNKTNLNIKSE